jgi:hypothetical protein
MKIGVNLSIDCTSIDKARLVNHSNGKVYLNMTAFIDTEELDQYGNSGFISQSVSKEEREQGVKGDILGNSKVFYKTSTPEQGKQGIQDARQAATQAQPPADDFDDTIPF